MRKIPHQEKNKAKKNLDYENVAKQLLNNEKGPHKKITKKSPTLRKSSNKAPHIGKKIVVLPGGCRALTAAHPADTHA